MTAADRPRVGDQITTAEQYETVRAWFFERGEYLIVAEGRRPWIITEDERGDAWAWSWLEEQGPDQREGEGPGGTVVDAEALRLPLTVLYVPGEPSRPSVTDNARAEAERIAQQHEWTPVDRCICGRWDPRNGVGPRDFVAHVAEDALAADRPSVTGAARADLHPVITEHQIIGTQTGKQGAGQVVPEDSVLCAKCGWMGVSDYLWHLSDALRVAARIAAGGA